MIKATIRLFIVVPVAQVVGVFPMPGAYSLQART
jgi:hypothetical protein